MFGLINKSSALRNPHPQNVVALYSQFSTKLNVIKVNTVAFYVHYTVHCYLFLLDGWMNGVLGHFYALSRLNWAGDNLG